MITLSNVLNPKGALFFLALLPQFVDKSSAHPTLALLMLGLTFVLTDTLWCLCLVVFAGFLTDHIERSPRLFTLIASITGLTFVMLGLLFCSVKS